MIAELCFFLLISSSLVCGQAERTLEGAKSDGLEITNITQKLEQKIQALEQQNNNLQNQFNTIQNQMSKILDSQDHLNTIQHQLSKRLESSNAREACFEDLANSNCTGSQSGQVGIVEAVRVAGGWGPYSDWSPCSVTCGAGVQVRNRTCSNPSPKYGGPPCAGAAVDQRKCNIEPCCPEGWIKHDGHCYNCVEEDNIAYYQNDLLVGRNYVKTDAAHQCAKWCGITEGCKFWTFRKSEKVCWLKYSNAGRRSDSDAISGTKSCAKDSELKFQLKGKAGQENVTISIDGHHEEFGLTTEWQTFSYPRPASGSFSVEFHNDAGHTDVHIRGHESQVQIFFPTSALTKVGDVELQSKMKDVRGFVVEASCGMGNIPLPSKISAEVEKVQTGHQRRLHPVPVADQAGCPPQINLDVHRRSRLDEQCQMNHLEELEVSMITASPTDTTMLALLLLLCTARLTESRSLGDDVLSFSIVHMNDIHAHFDEVNINTGRCHKEQAESGKCFGGMGRMFTAVQDLVSKDPDNTLLLNAGDYFQGTMWFSELGYEPVARFGNMMNWTAMGLGNHEFDLAVGGLANFSKAATFDLIATNVVQNEADTDQIKFKASKVVEVKGTKIGIIGYVTAETADITAGRIPTITFLDEIESVRKEARRLKAEEGVEILIALGHAGYVLDMKMAEEIEEIDLVVGGHSHSFLHTGQLTEDMTETVEGEFPTYVKQEGGKVVPVVQVYKYSKYLGVLDLNFNAEGDLILPVNGSGVARAEIVTIDNKYEKNPWIEAQLDLYREKLDDYYPAIGCSNVLLEKIDNAESNIGNVVTDAMVRNSRWNDTRIAFQNTGGIRGTIDPGEITGEDIIQILPFVNTIDRVTISGRNIRELLAKYVSFLCPNQTCNPPTFLVHSGLKVVYDIYEDPQLERLTSVKVRCDDDSESWCDIEEETVYPVALLSFLANGGSRLFNFPDFIEDHQIGDLDSLALRKFVEENSPINYGTEGRITIKYH